MSLFSMNRHPFWSERFFDESSDEDEYEQPARVGNYRYAPDFYGGYPASRQGFHPAYFQHPYRPSYYEEPCSRQAQGILNPRQHPRFKKRNVMGERTIPVPISHERPSNPENAEATKGFEKATKLRKSKKEAKSSAGNYRNVKRDFLLHDPENEADTTLEQGNKPSPPDPKNAERTASFSSGESEVGIEVDHDQEDEMSSDKRSIAHAETESDTENCQTETITETEVDIPEPDAAERAKQQIASVMEDMDKLESEIDSFSGSRKEKTFLRLEHELTNKLLRLDGVSATGSGDEINDIRSKRKAAVTQIQRALDRLESNVLP